MRERNSVGGLPGRGIGFQINAVILVGVLLMVTILMSVISWMTFEDLVDGGRREKFNELGKLGAGVEMRYEMAKQSSERLRLAVDRQLEGAPAGRSRAELVALLRDTVASNKNLVGAGVTFEPNAYDGNDAAYAGTQLGDPQTGRMSLWVDQDGTATYLNGYDTGTWYQMPMREKKMMLGKN